MSVFLTPALETVLRGYLFPLAHLGWRPVSDRARVDYREAGADPARDVLESAEKFTPTAARTPKRTAAAQRPSPSAIAAGRGLAAVLSTRIMADSASAPKFPLHAIELLFRRYRRVKDASRARPCSLLRRAMANGGLYDHLGGGFHRYSVDERWLDTPFREDALR